MTDYETTQLERIKAYLDKEGMSYHTHTENAVKKHAKSNITIHGYNIYIFGFPTTMTTFSGENTREERPSFCIPTKNLTAASG